jgi:carbon-monoxide dehydrogenase medium subunit
MFHSGGRGKALKPPPFAYVDPGSVTEALNVLAEHGDEGKILAGGQSLVPLLNMRLAQPRILIDLNRIPELASISDRTRDGTQGVAFGAMTRQRSVEDAKDALTCLPLLAEAIAWVGHPQIRNRGTIGGSISHADPSAELPLVFRAHDGVATVRSRRGERSIPASDFFLYTFTPALEPDEMLVEIWLPVLPGRTGQAFLEVARRHGDFALVAVAVSLTLGEHGVCTDARIAVGGASPVPMRASEGEQALIGQRAGLELFRQAGKLAAEATEPTGDVHADAAYRREVAGTLTARALALAFERIPETPREARA